MTLETLLSVREVVRGVWVTEVLSGTSTIAASLRNRPGFCKSRKTRPITNFPRTQTRMGEDM